MKKRVLIVDNEPGLTFFLAENLAELGPDYEIETCNSGREALTLNSARPFDLVITDLVMPGLNGLELARFLIQQCPGIRLILMTAYGDDRTAIKAKKLGITAYITKPFAMEEMLGAVEAALNNFTVSQPC